MKFAEFYLPLANPKSSTIEFSTPSFSGTSSRRSSSVSSTVKIIKATSLPLPRIFVPLPDSPFPSSLSFPFSFPFPFESKQNISYLVLASLRSSLTSSNSFNFAWSSDFPTVYIHKRRFTLWFSFFPPAPRFFSHLEPTIYRRQKFLYN